ncbi:MAG: cation:proton antiporter [Thermoflexibacter sp.]
MIHEGKLLEISKIGALINTGEPIPSQDIFSIFYSQFGETLHHPTAILILQIITIIFFARIFAISITKIRQPTVIGEIIAGIILGKSVLGTFFPEFSAFLFPPESLAGLHFLSQLGLILFMFIIGMELDVNILRQKAQTALTISHATISFCFFLGASLSYLLYEQYAPANVSFLSFALFMGIALSTTAFPVLARIIQEKELTKTPLGTLIITCAATDDVTAWCLLAVIIAIVKAGTIIGAFFTILFSIIYVLLMIYVVRPLLYRVSIIYASKEALNKNVVALFFIVLLASAYVTEIIGIHALFGAFLAGAVIPNDINFKKILTEKIEDISLVLLLPLFFVFTGLRTEIGLLKDLSLLSICLVVIATAMVGKIVGATTFARILGQTWKDSLLLGVFMNTRGLMELIILNIGYDLGVLSPQIFSMMVLMAVATTLMTGPGVDFINFIFERYKPLATSKIRNNTFQIIISFGPPQMGSKLLELVSQFTYKISKQVNITALHLTPSTQLSQIDALTFEREAFEPVEETAEQMGLHIETKYKVSEDVGREVANTANKGGYDMLIVGSAKSLFSKDKLGGTVRNILHYAECPVAVFIERGFQTANKIVLFLDNERDIPLLNLTKKFLDNVTFLVRIVYHGDLYKEVAKFLTDPEIPTQSVSIIHKENFHAGVFEETDLVIMSLTYWQLVDEEEVNWIEQMPSVLIIKEYRVNF